MARSRRLDFGTFRDRFDTITADNGTTWESVGFLAPDGTVYAFGTDSKVISTVFEAIAAPVIQAIAEEAGYQIEGSPQTIYPDFTLTPKETAPVIATPCRIAIDIKTTYRGFTRQRAVKPFRYTLGSYTSFLRSPTATKNIKYPYMEYSDHWVVGFLYTRREGVPAKVYHRPDPSKLVCPYHDVVYFAQEKYKIVGLSPGSGNTANIGSLQSSNIEDFREGRGPFAAHGKAVCDEYWRNYGRTAAERLYTNIETFLAWQKAQDSYTSRGEQ
jgi:hypothetical protein